MEREDIDLLADLTGGFDSRLAIPLLLKNDEVLNRAHVYTLEGPLSSHDEDYRVASQIADYYGFVLNRTLIRSGDAIAIDWNDCMRISFFTKLGFHKEMYFQQSRSKRRRYRSCGFGGERLRSYWNLSEEQYIERMARQTTSRFSSEVSREVSSSVRNVLQRAFSDIDRVRIEAGRLKAPENVMTDFYRDTRCRNHFGRASFEAMFGNCIMLCPLLDRAIHKLKLNSAYCDDRNFLAAVIYSRYTPHLIEVPFDGGRAIDAATVEAAKYVNSIFPYVGETEESIRVGPIDSKSSGLAKPVPEAIKDNGNAHGTGDVATRVRLGFESREMRQLASRAMPVEIYDWVSERVGDGVYHPLKDAFVVLAACGVEYALEFPNSEISSDFADYINLCSQALENRRAEGVPENPHPIHSNLLPYVSIRVDALLEADGNELLCDVYSYQVRKIAPSWIGRMRSGYVIEAKYMPLKIGMRCVKGKERVKLSFKGLDVRDDRGERLPCWITLTSVKVDGDEMLANETSVCHDKPWKVWPIVGSEKETIVEAEWRPFGINTEDARNAGYPLHACKPSESVSARIAELEKLNTALVLENMELRDMVESRGVKPSEA